MNSNSKIWQRILNIVLRTLLAAAIITLLVWLRREQLKQCLSEFNYLWVLPAIVCQMLHQVVGAWRWRRLAVIQGFDLSAFEAYSLTMQGYFFSLIIPGGAIGGDVAKMGLLARRSRPGCRAEGVFTVFMDRVIGMIALFLLCIALLLLFGKRFTGLQISGLNLSGDELLIGAGLLFLLCLAGITCGIAVFFHRKLQKIPGVTGLLNWIDRHTGNAASRMMAMADNYAAFPGELITLTLISIAGVHIMTTIPMLFLLAGAGVALNISSIVLILTAVTIGNIAGLIPITPGGIGLRDLTVISLLSAGGIAPGIGETAQLMATGITILSNLPGGIFLIIAPAGIKHQPENSNPTEP